LNIPQKVQSNISEGLEVPAEREQENNISVVPLFKYIRNECHFRKNKYRHLKKSPSKQKKQQEIDDEEISINSHTTYKIMPNIVNPREFRYKSNLCKSVLNFEVTQIK